MILDKDKFPVLYEAFYLITLDHGCPAGLVDHVAIMTIPDELVGEARLAEIVLSKLSRFDTFPSWMPDVQESSWETFLSGEASDIEKLMSTPVRRRVNYFVNQWFDGFPDL